MKTAKSNTHPSAEAHANVLTQAPRPLGRPRAQPQLALSPTPVTTPSAIIPPSSMAQACKPASRTLRSCDTVTHLPATPSEASGLQWPAAFLESPHGERIQLSEDMGRATRQSGVGGGTCFLGPLQLEKGNAYFEFEVLELETQRSQTMAIGVCCSPPTQRPLRVQKASELGQGSFLLGYDLPKFIAHGKDVAKIATREWRPLKELVVGARIGLLVERTTMELTVFVNGVKKASVTAPGVGDPQQRWPAEMWGVVDVHGTVRSVRLRKPGVEGSSRGQPVSSPTRALSPCGRTGGCSEVAPGHPARSKTDAFGTPRAEGAVEALVQEAGATERCPPPPSPPPTRLLAETQDGGLAAPASVALPAGDASVGSKRARRAVEASAPDEAARSAKRLRLATHPCGCTVHLIRHTGCVVHVPLPDFVIGRNPSSCNLTLDSKMVPNMVSRKHTRILSTDAGVEAVDCGSLNGTWLNGHRVQRQMLKQGDVVVVGSPGQAPAEFGFSISMPA